MAIAQVIIVVTVTYLTLILGELVPKRIGMSSSERVAKIVARPMSLLSKIALPFVWLLSKSTGRMLRILGINTVDGNRVTEEEIKAIIQEGAAEGEIEEVEQDIVERVFNLSDRNVGSIMTHRSDMVWLDTNAIWRPGRGHRQEQPVQHLPRSRRQPRLDRRSSPPQGPVRPARRTRIHTVAGDAPRAVHTREPERVQRARPDAPALAAGTAW